MNFTQIFTSAANFLPTATLGWMIENGFLQKSDLWAAVTNPAVAKRITKEFCTGSYSHTLLKYLAHSQARQAVCARGTRTAQARAHGRSGLRKVCGGMFDVCRTSVHDTHSRCRRLHSRPRSRTASCRPPATSRPRARLRCTRRVCGDYTSIVMAMRSMVIISCKQRKSWEFVRLNRMTKRENMRNENSIHRGVGIRGERNDA